MGSQLPVFAGVGYKLHISLLTALFSEDVPLFCELVQHTELCELI